MNLQQLRNEAWAIARELKTPDAQKLWPADEMNMYINRIYRDIARKTKCIRDARTPAIAIINLAVVDYTTLTLAANGLDYIYANDPGSMIYQANVCPYVFPLHKAIIDIDDVKIIEKQYKLYKVSSQKWMTNVVWEQTMGLPTEYATDLQNRSLAVNFRSDENLTLQLAVKRMPLVDLEKDEDEPEIREDYHDFFRNGVLEQMYSKQDSEAFDMEKSGSYRAKYKKDITSINRAEIKLNEMLSPNYAMDGHR